MPDDFIYVPLTSGDFEIATFQKIEDSTNPIHIYIEGDGAAFDAAGRPRHNPTPRGRMVRQLAYNDTSPNVVYMARPCQFIMSPACNPSDWTDGRFSENIIDSVAGAINQIAQNRPIILIGYSGGALVSGLVIERHPEINVRQWITIAGVLNHDDWTSYFGDSPLSASLNLNGLPHVSQTHYVGEFDETVPYELSTKWTGGKNMIVVPGAAHDDFGNLKIF